MLSRVAQTVVEERLRRYPAVALVGPRQAGKTTLAQALSATYFDLEQEADRLRVDLEWPSLVEGLDLVVLDEAQAAPELFPRLRGAIDAHRKKNGRFLLLGSVSPALMHQVGESLAGRLSIVELTPLLAPEVAATKLDDLWLFGGYPDGGILNAGAFPQWQLDYTTLLTMRDLPQWGLSAKPATIERLLRMVAAVHGQVWNASKIGQSLGLSYHTVNDYLDHLRGAFLVRELRPYQANLGKRLSKRPKVYLRDTGVLHSLLGVHDRTHLLGQPWVGASWEGFVIEQIISCLSIRTATFEPFFLRTSDGYEIDLVIEGGRERWAIEIKLTTAPSTNDLASLRKVAGMVDADRRFLISRVDKAAGNLQERSCSLPDFLELVLDDRIAP